MQFRLASAGRPLLALFGGALIGAFLALEVPQLPSLADRPSCTETVMHAVSSDRLVSGTYACFNPRFQLTLKAEGIDSDGAFALKVGQNGEYHFVRKTADGGYVYEYDRMTAPHDRVQGALGALGFYRIAADVHRGNLPGAWQEKNDFSAAWAEITGKTQDPQSTVFIFYLDDQGKIRKVV